MGSLHDDYVGLAQPHNSVLPYRFDYCFVHELICFPQIDGIFFSYYVREMKKTSGINGTRQNVVINREKNESAATIAA